MLANAKKRIRRAPAYSRHLDELHQGKTCREGMENVMSDNGLHPRNSNRWRSRACGDFTEAELDEFEFMLREERTCRWYCDYCLMDAELRFLVAADKAGAVARAVIETWGLLLLLPSLASSPPPSTARSAICPRAGRWRISWRR